MKKTEGPRDGPVEDGKLCLQRTLEEKGKRGGLDLGDRPQAEQKGVDKKTEQIPTAKRKKKN